MIEIKPITQSNEQALNLPNEPFPLLGRMQVSRSDDQWHYQIVAARKNDQQTFPDENYQLAEVNQNGFALGAFTADVCVGLAIFADHWNQYLYLDDLKVKRSYRRQGISRQMLQAAKNIARTRGYRGIYTIGQDNNLNACQFYLATGFVIGGFNSRDYQGTSQEGKSDIYFYWDF